MPTTKFLFWNLGGKPLAVRLAALAHAEAADVIVLAECSIPPGAMLLALNRPDPSAFHLAPGLCKSITVFARFPGYFLSPGFESERISIRRLELPARLPVLLAAVHLPSKLYWSAESQALECTELARQILRQEEIAGHQRTILLGDFNMNPFEAGVVGAAGLNAVMSRHVASRQSRTVQGRDYRYFYNPMWGHFGDLKRHTAGSYLYDAGEHVSYYWNVFDQVMLRPELAATFDPNQLSIVTCIGRQSLVRDDGRPDPAAGSDHLPIVFEVEF